MTWKCPFCGNENVDDANFCTKCGAKKPESLTLQPASSPGSGQNAQPVVQQVTSQDGSTAVQVTSQPENTPTSESSPMPEGVKNEPATVPTEQAPAQQGASPEPTQGTSVSQEPSQMQQDTEKYYIQFINTPNPQFNKTKIPLEFDVFPSISLGRSPENVIVIPDPEVSRKHAIIYYENGKLEIEDLNSTNGTYIYDGKMFQPVKGKVEIQPNSVLKLANNTVVKVVKD